MTTSQAIQDNMTDFADEHGDQELIKEMIVWLNHKMGGYWNVAKLDNGIRSTKLQMLEKLRIYLHDVPAETIDELRTISFIYDFIIEEQSKL